MLVLPLGSSSKESKVTWSVVASPSWLFSNSDLKDSEGFFQVPNGFYDFVKHS